ncbi:hypothetical protein AB0M28_20800 [Streptomyces sp. NPDC051940]
MRSSALFLMPGGLQAGTVVGGQLGKSGIEDQARGQVKDLLALAPPRS